MGKKSKIRVGLLITNDDVGVIYYLLSIVKSLTVLPSLDRPTILLFYAVSCRKYISLFEYENLESIVITPPHPALQYFQFIFTRRNLLIEKLANAHNVDIFFPLNDTPSKGHGYYSVSWIPDFQHKFYPSLFTKKNLLLREKRFKLIIENTNALVLSSENAHQHLRKHYTLPDDLKVHILPFVSLIRDYTLPPLSTVKKKYFIDSPYFLVSNQFYEHKNHIVVFKALKTLKQKGINLLIIFTGKPEDYRNPKFFPDLVQTISEWGLTDTTKLLGLIPREEQLSLMQGALAVVQPSKFEGWSTSIEDAKTLGIQVVCSKIPVHEEQMEEKAFYFEPDDAEALAIVLQKISTDSKHAKPLTDTYEQRVRIFATKFVNIFQH